MNPIYLLITSAISVTAVSARADLFVNSFTHNSIRRYDENTGAFLSTFISSGSGGLSAPQRGIFGVDGNFYVTSANNDRVLRYHGQTGAFIDVFIQNGTNGLPAGTLDYPVDLTIGPDGALYVSSQLTDSVLRFNATTGAFIDTFAVNPFVTDQGPTGIQFYNGDLFVAGAFSQFVYRYDGTTGAFELGIGIDVLSATNAFDFGPDGKLYVASRNSWRVEKFDPWTAAHLSTFISAGSGGLSYPSGLEFGPDNNLYVVHTQTASVKKYDGVTGAFVGDFVAAGSGGLHSPSYISFVVPEPSVATLLAGALVALTGRRRKCRP